MTIAVTGGTGFLGRSVLRVLAERDRPVRCLVREGTDAPAGVEVVRGDLADLDALRALVTGADAVIHLAAVMGTMNEALLDAVNVLGTKDVLAMAADAGVPRFVLASSVAAGRPEHGPYSRSKARAEDVVKRGAIPGWVIVRPPVIVGPGSQVERTLENLGRLPIVPVIGGRQPLRPVPVEEVAAACADAALQADAAGTWTLAGADALTFPDLARRMLGELGLRGRPVAIPGPLALVIARVAQRVLPAPPVTVEGVRAVLAGSPPGGRA